METAAFRCIAPKASKRSGLGFFWTCILAWWVSWKQLPSRCIAPNSFGRVFFVGFMAKASSRWIASKDSTPSGLGSFGHVEASFGCVLGGFRGRSFPHFALQARTLCPYFKSHGLWFLLRASCLSWRGLLLGIFPGGFETASQRFVRCLSLASRSRALIHLRPGLALSCSVESSDLRDR